MSVDTVMCVCFERALGPEFARAFASWGQANFPSLPYFCTTTVHVSKRRKLTVVRIHIEGIDVEATQRFGDELKALGRKFDASATVVLDLGNGAAKALQELHEKLDLLGDPFLTTRLEVDGAGWVEL